MYNEMMRAEIWLQDHVNSQKGIEDLAGRLGYSTSQVRRRFKQCFGLSPSAYRDRLRLEKAARLLAFTPFPIQAIATRCGYQNHSAFSRAFQRCHNQTPRQYRHAIRLQLRHNPYCQGDNGNPPNFEIYKAPPRQALVTRLYRQARSNPVRALQEWRRHARNIDGLSERLKLGRTFALMHNMPLRSETERIDVGPLITQGEASNMPIPASFRLLKIPAQHHARAEVESLDQIPDAVQYLISHGLTSKRCHATGDPLEVEWGEDQIELRLPVQLERA
jgi:AraC-like DNA-binding protein